MDDHTFNLVSQLLAWLIVIAFCISCMTWASHMADRKRRSRRLWRVLVMLFWPLVLLLWLLPCKGERTMDSSPYVQTSIP
jgi:hypothetical protein